VIDSAFRTDVIVIGGGPSGLLLASRIAPELSVCILEKGELGRTTKFWLTSSARLVKNDLLSTLRFKTNRATIGTFQGSFAYAEGDFATVDESELLRVLVERCVNNGVRLVAQAKVLSVVQKGSEMVVETTNGRYFSRLVIDASGGASALAATYKMHRLEGFYSIYGGHLENLSLASTNVIGAHVLHFGNPTPVFELIPTSENSAFCVVFMASRRVINPNNLAQIFEEHVSYNPFFVRTAHHINPDLKMGVVPIGRAISRDRPGILSIGEAGMFQSPLLGGAFNEILETASMITTQVKDAFKYCSAGVAQMRLRLPLRKCLNDQAQLLLVRKILDGSLDSFEALVRFIRDLGPSAAYRLLCTELNWSDLSALVRAAGKFLMSKQ
jgi:flavin-dependent dehydrogenase